VQWRSHRFHDDFPCCTVVVVVVVDDTNITLVEVTTWR